MGTKERAMSTFALAKIWYSEREGGTTGNRVTVLDK